MKKYRAAAAVIILLLLTAVWCVCRAARYGQAAGNRRVWYRSLTEEPVSAPDAAKSETDEITPDMESEGITPEAEPEETAPGTEPEEQLIRVRLTVSDFSSEIHPFVVLSSPDTFTLQSGSRAQIYTGGQTVTVSPDHPFLADGSILVIGESGGVQIDSIAHRGQPQWYPGSLELYPSEGGIRIVNELPLEAYVERVVPSEMPPSYGAEAARLQAVCTRTYAYRKLTAETPDAYGAIVNDSVNYQVYNAAPAAEVSSQAAADTRGIVMTWQGEPFVPYFFSTSCGYNSGNEIWGGKPLPFLRTQNLTFRNEIDCQQEGVFSAFIMNWDYPAYEDDCTWYRWDYSISMDNLKTMLIGRIDQLYAEVPEAFRAEDSGGNSCVVQAAFVDGLQEIRVTRRLSGGMAAEAAIICEQGTIYAQREMILRRLFGSPARLYRNQSDEGSGISEGDYLPSAFFYPAQIIENNAVSGYTFCGGGNGHGIGLSQNAAAALLQNGLTWQEVLQFFYLGTGMKVVY